jgi:hypothetical protein
MQHTSRPFGFGASFRTAAARRGTVLGLYAGYAGLAGCLVALAARPEPYAARLLLSGAAVLLLLVVIVCGAGVQALGRGIADDADHALDERQLALRNAAYLGAYRAVAAVCVLGALYLAVAADAGLPLPGSLAARMAAAWGVCILCLTLPSAILAWNEPAPGFVDEEGPAGPWAAPAR